MAMLNNQRVSSPTIEFKQRIYEDTHYIYMGYSLNYIAWDIVFSQFKTIFDIYIDIYIGNILFNNINILINNI
jgi:hypothetical protein